jgi:hypothetical protein
MKLSRRSSLFTIASIFLLATSFSGSVKLANPGYSQETQAASGAAPTTFRWISATRERNLLEKIKAAFAEELKPDANGDASPDAIHYRYLGRVGITGNIGLVLIGNRNDPKVSAFDYFNVYSFDLETASKKKIVTASPLYLLRYKSLAHFESGKAPDVIFECQSCVECEPATLVVSFGIVSNAWSLRNWTANGTSLGLGGVQDPEGDEAEVMEHAYRVGDFEQKRKDQIAVWIRTRRIASDDSGKIHSESNSTFIYSLGNGILQKEDILDPVQISKLQHWICEADTKVPLCQAKL